ncbi:MAG: M14 family metallopeptidase [Clostridia bacterium]|nr:M14 family metallopeptidase [Clostridia bacterium]
MIKGRLAAKAAGDKIRVYFMQRGSCPEDANVPVKVYRRSADEINFSTGMCGDAPGAWTEYIDNQRMDDPRVRMVFDGVLPCENSFCSYMDEDVAYGHTYLYWVVSDEVGERIQIGPVACKLRDPEIWWGYDRAVEEMKKLCGEYPSLVRMEAYGSSTRHRPIYGLKIGSGEKTLVLAGAIHASEPGPELLVRALRFILAEHAELLSRVNIAVMPEVNVDVREETVEGEPFYLRKNPNGVDLNRNFDWKWKQEYVYGYDNSDPDASTYHGPFAASENETQAAVAFVRSVEKVCAVFVYDSSSVITEDWLLMDSFPGDDDFEENCRIANLYSQAFREDHEGCGTFTAEPMHYPIAQMECFAGTGQPHGTFEGWAHETYGVPAYSLQSAGSKEGRVNSDDAVTRELLDQWSRRHAWAIIALLKEYAA